eukprot:TRINITY_DN15590_c0_g1_i1.p2 TRINITY_DN15590_c0_g1~~TRINITY_DN15590_c0_g1_i1.p2  ORF type:complete len:423 (-),score=119.42 TRINITY_DN15590_c0_g1_i1:655-1923(-)
MAEVVEEQHSVEEQQEEIGRKNPWGRANVNWAEDVENAELSGELKVIQPLSDIQIQDEKLKKMVVEDEEEEDFPSLSSAKGKKVSKGKKGGKNQKVSLQAFQAQGMNDNFNANAIRMNLPSYSRQKVPGEEEDRRRPFSNDGYDGRRGGGFEREDGGGFRERRRRDDSFEPSKADTVDSWGSTNKFTPASRGFGEHREGSRGFGEHKEPSRGFGDYKEPSRGFSDYKEPSRGPPPRRGGAGFGDTYKAYDFPNSHADGKDSWQSERSTRNDYDKEYQPPRRGGGGGGGRGGGEGFDGGYAPFSDGRGPPRRSAGFVADSKADFEDKWTMGSKYSKAEASEEQGAFSSIKQDPRRRWSRGTDGFQETYTPPAPQQSAGAYVPPSQRKDPFGGARPREQVLSDKDEQQHNDMHAENGTSHTYTE